MDSLKQALINNPGTGMISSLTGYILSLIEMLPGILRFIILIASTVTAISLAYIHLRRALVVKKQNKN